MYLDNTAYVRLYVSPLMSRKLMATFLEQLLRSVKSGFFSVPVTEKIMWSYQDSNPRCPEKDAKQTGRLKILDTSHRSVGILM